MNKKHFYPTVILLLFLAIGIQPALGVINVPSQTTVNGTTIATWDGSTYTLIADVTEGLVIEQSNLTLDGAGHTVSGSSGPGVHVFSKDNCTIQNLNVTGCNNGIFLQDSTNITVNNNNVHFNNIHGIFIGTSMGSSYNNTLSNNTVSNNTGIGISLGGGSPYNNKIYNNTVSNNVGKGIYLCLNANSNEIYNNNFIGNTPNADNAGSGNVFFKDLPIGGNYWSDYTGADNGSEYPPGYPRTAGDGIGDTLLPHSGVDIYPWVIENGWLSPELLIEALIVKVEDLNGEYGINNALDAKLQNALDALEAKNAGQRQDAINKMQSFINAVEAQRDNKIPGDVADELIDDANYIISLL